MSSDGRKAGGLAARMVRVALFIGIITLLSAGAVSSVGAYRLAQNQVAARDQTTLQMAEDHVAAQLTGMEAVASQVAVSVAATSGAGALDAAISSTMEHASVKLAECYVTTRTGRVLTAYPLAAESSRSISPKALSNALGGALGFRREQTPEGLPELWLTRTCVTPSGAPAVVLVRSGTGFVDRILGDGPASGQSSVALLESGKVLAKTGARRTISFSGVRWNPSGTNSGSGRIQQADGTALTAYYRDLRGFEGLEWRLVVVEPLSVVVADTTVAVAPSIAVLLAGGAIALAAIWLLLRRMVTPLRVLHTMAMQAARGAYVKPIPASPDDEIGMVAEAFNEVALRLNALHDLSQLLASASQLDQVLDGILGAMGHILGPGVAAVYLADEAGEWLVPVRVRGIELPTVGRVARSGPGWLATAASSTDTVVHMDSAAVLERELPGLAHGETVALIAPLISGHETLGVVAALRHGAEPISDAEREMVRTFSAQAAVAVQNSRLFEAERESVRVAEGLRSVAERLVVQVDLNSALEDVQVVVSSLFRGAWVGLAVSDRAPLGLPPAEDRALEIELLALGARVLGHAEGVTPVAVYPGDDAGADAVMARTEASSLLVAPVALESGHGAVAVVALTSGGVTSRDLDLATAVFNEVALAFDNAYNFQSAMGRAANLETILRISQAVGSSLQVNVVLNRVLDVVQKILSADGVALLTYDNRKRKIVTAMARGSIPQGLLDVALVPGEDLPGYVFSTGEPASLPELREEMGGVAGDAAANGLLSLVAVPLLARGRSVGVLVVYSADAHAFAEEDVGVLQTFAAQAALAIDTARLYSREHEVASILQQSILPEALPRFAEVDADSVYQPAGGDAEIGGDYYDLFRAPDNAIWFAIADVCGKGVSAATKTSMIKYSVRSLVRPGLGPAAVLGEVNRMVTDAGEPSDIVTLWLGRYDAVTATLNWANAGHPPGMLMRRDGGIERFGPTGPLLGAVGDVIYDEESTVLQAGDSILVYTDGVTEARHGNEFFGEERVAEVLEAGGEAEEVVRRLLTAVRRFVHGELRDDIAALAVRINPTAAAGSPVDTRDEDV